MQLKYMPLNPSYFLWQIESHSVVCESERVDISMHQKAKSGKVKERKEISNETNKQKNFSKKPDRIKI